LLVIHWGAVTGTVPGDDTRCGTRLLLGAYVLGGLSEPEEAAVEAHMSHCAPCRVEFEELACVPEWLDLMPVDECPMAAAQRQAVLLNSAPGARSDVSE
jgi:anti-sigma factor RsiW